MRTEAFWVTDRRDEPLQSGRADVVAGSFLTGTLLGGRAGREDPISASGWSAAEGDWERLRSALARTGRIDPA